MPFHLYHALYLTTHLVVHNLIRVVAGLHTSESGKDLPLQRKHPRLMGLDSERGGNIVFITYRTLFKVPLLQRHLNWTFKKTSLNVNIIYKIRHGQCMRPADHMLLRPANRLLVKSTNYDSLYYAVITIFLLLIAVLDSNSNSPLDRYA